MQNARSDRVCLDFSLLHFFVSRQRNEEERHLLHECQTLHSDVAGVTKGHMRQKIQKSRILILLWIYWHGRRPSPTDKEMKKKNICFISDHCSGRHRSQTGAIISLAKVFRRISGDEKRFRRQLQ